MIKEKIFKKVHIRKNDLVAVISGKNKGKRGKILKVFPKQGKAIVEKINLIKRHTRPRRQGEQGGIIEKEAPIHTSNLMLICNKCNRPVRIRKKILENREKIRVCSKCGEII